MPWRSAASLRWPTAAVFPAPPGVSRAHHRLDPDRTVAPAARRSTPRRHRDGHRHRHRARLPQAGGAWQRDRGRPGLKHRNGQPWDRVREPWRAHSCRPQTALVWTFRTPRGGWHVAAVLWCACGGVTYPGVGGRWLGRNLRRARPTDTFPAWHRHLDSLDQLHPHPGGTRTERDANAVPGGWRRAGRNRVAAGGELVRPPQRQAS